MSDATDILGYKRTVKANGALYSSEYATVKLGAGGNLGLVQSVRGSYSQTVNAKFESGSPTLYWQTGQAQGQISIGRLVGEGGFWAGFSSVENSCGELTNVTIGLDGDVGCATATLAGNGAGGLKYTNAVVQGFGFDWSAGGLDINESVQIAAGSMVRT